MILFKVTTKTHQEVCSGCFESSNAMNAVVYRVAYKSGGPNASVCVYRMGRVL